MSILSELIDMNVEKIEKILADGLADIKEHAYQVIYEVPDDATLRAYETLVETHIGPIVQSYSIEPSATHKMIIRIIHVQSLDNDRFEALADDVGIMIHSVRWY